MGLVGCGIAAACSSFSGADTPTKDDAGIATPDAGTSETTDGAAADATTSDGAVMGAACPPPAGPATLGNNMVELAAPPSTDVEYPFQIATDADHVYWTAQWTTKAAITLDAGASIQPYNGGATTTRIHRQSKTPADQNADTLVEDEPRIEAIARDGAYLYWGTSDGSNGVLRRVPADCIAPCAGVTTVGDSIPERIQRIYVAAPGVLALLGASQSSYVYNDATGRITPIGTTGTYPSLAVRTDDAFLGYGLGPELRTATSLSTTPASSPFTEFPDSGGGNVGASALATDCTNLYAYGADHQIWRLDLTAPTPQLSKWLDPQVAGGTELAADSRYLYLSAYNAGGVFAFDKTSGQKASIASGNVWSLHVDADGVYWGEHDQRTGGALFMLRNR